MNALKRVVVSASFLLALAAPAARGQDCPEAATQDCNSNGLPDSYDLSTDFIFHQCCKVVDVGGDPFRLIAVDLDGDRLPEVIAARQSGKAVSISKNLGGLLFLDDPPALLPLDGDPLAVAPIDLDGDAAFDLAVSVDAGGGAGHLECFRNRGDGSMDDLGGIPLNPVPRFVLAADLDGDGLADLALSRNGISVLPSRGSGAFDPPRELAGGSLPQGLAADDFDGDGRTDLAAANEVSGDISVHLNQGGWTFEEKAMYPVGSGPRSLAAADLDGDLLPDLAVACRDSGEIVVLRNEGGGRFREAGRVPLDGKPSPLGAFDVDGDGDIDLVAAVHRRPNPNRIMVLRNDGKGGFREAVRVEVVRRDLADLAAADLDGDGRPDLAVTWQNGSNLLQSGVAPYRNEASGDNSQDCDSDCIPDECQVDCNWNRVGDLCDIARGTSADCNSNGVPDECDISRGPSRDCNGNGVPDECDIAGGASRDCDGEGVPDECDIARALVSDCNGNGVPDGCDIASGTSLDCDANGVPDECDLLVRPDFPGGVGIDVRGDPQSSTVGDLDGNGLADLVVPVSPPGGGPGRIALIFARGEGDYAVRTVDFGREMAGGEAALGDFDGDGALDIAVTGPSLEPGSSRISVLLGQPGGTFTLGGTQTLSGSAGPIAAEDLDGDGMYDLAAGTFDAPSNAGTLWILTHQGGGGFGEARGIPVTGNPKDIAAADLDGDRAVDLLVARIGIGKPWPDGLAVFWSRADGTFEPPLELPDDRDPENFSNPCSLALADLDGDGDLDVAAADENRHRLRVFLNRPGRTFERAPDLPTGQCPMALAAGDLNGDGRPDLAVETSCEDGIMTFLDKGAGSFSPGPTYRGTDARFQSIHLADFDGDGDIDLSQTASGLVWLMLLEGDGALEAGQRIPIDAGMLVAADLDGDGLTDLAADAGGRVSVLWNEGGRRFGPEASFPCSPELNWICGGELAFLLPGDFDGDGLLDLVALQGCEAVPLLHTSRRSFSLASVSEFIPKEPEEEGGERICKFRVAGAVTGDLDGDGFTDIAAAAGYSVWVARNPAGTGIFIPEGLYDSGDETMEGLAIGDLDGDGTLDLASANCTDIVVHLNRNGFERNRVSVDGCFRKIAIGDLNGDGNQDMAICNDSWSEEAEGFGLLWGLGGGAFASGAPLYVHGPCFNLKLGDMDGDRDIDIAALQPFGLGLLVNNGRGAFEVEYLRPGSSPYFQALEDLDGDGARDPVVSMASSLWILWNDPRPRSLDRNGDSIPDECQSPENPVRFRRGDVNGDGTMDLSDPICILFYLFGGQTIPCLKAADIDDTGALDISDPIRLLGALFLGTLPPSAPYPGCGWDPKPDGLSCERSDACR
jgi:hypothetical protein